MGKQARQCGSQSRKFGPNRAEIFNRWAIPKSIVSKTGLIQRSPKRFLTAPAGAEVTGVAESPDGKALFVNIQHPGENTTNAGFTAGIFESNWPANGSGIAAAYGPGGASGRPRSATVMITKNDGGVIGL